MKKLQIIKKHREIASTILIYISLEILNLVTILSSVLIPKTQQELILDHVPRVISVMANFDGIEYMAIANNGYGIFQQAFFPFYPFLISVIHKTTSIPTLYIGLLVSNISLIFAVYFLLKSFSIIFDFKKAFWFCLFLFFFPTSFFFTSLYTESLFLFLLSVTIYLVVKKRYWLALPTSLLLGLTRVPGIFTSVNYLGLGKRGLAVSLSAALGFLAYALYLFKTTGDFFYFLNVQEAFGANRSNNFVLLPQVLYRYFKIFLSFPYRFTHYVAYLEFISFTIVFLVLLFYLYKLWQNKGKNFNLLFGLGIFSLINILAPTLTGTLSAIPRYALLSISFFIFLSNINSEKFKKLILGIFIVFHIVLLALFSRGYFIS